MTKRNLIKVCGLREQNNIDMVAALGVDMLGFVFHPQSPRYVSMISSKVGLMPDYSPEKYNELEGNAPVQTTSPEKAVPKRVGVFVDDMAQNIVTRVYNFDLDYVQLHGSEPVETIENLRATLVPDIKPELKFIKAIQVQTAEDLQLCDAYEGHVDLFLFDTKGTNAGGNGTHFDWELLKQYQGQTPFLLSGGIGVDDVEEVLAFDHPQCVGVDVNSRFETAPGVKNVDKLKVFVEALKAR